MAKLIKKSSKKAGLPPGTLVHIGEERTGKVRVTVTEYDGQSFRERNGALDACYVFPPEPAVTWVNVDGVHQVEVLEKLGACFGIHPLALEDILNTEQRAKIEDYGEDLFMVVKMLSFNEEKDEIEAEQISLILRRNALLTFQEKEGDDFVAVRERLQSGKGRLRKMGADYLAYTLLDIVVDRYFGILEKLGEKIETLEGKLLSDPTPPTLRKIQQLKKEMLLLRKWVWPIREVVNGLERGEFPGIQDQTRVYLRDVYDHTVQVMDTIEIFRDMLSGMLDIYLSNLSYRMSAVMKVLAIIATVFMPLTFLAGIYGMNFKHMPELEWPWGYPLILAVMAAIATFMLILFRRRKWL